MAAAPYSRSYAQRRTWGPAGAPADFGGKAPAQKGYEEYLDKLQLRNRTLRKLNRKDPAQAEREERERGFSTYVNGSHKSRQSHNPTKAGKRRRPFNPKASSGPGHNGADTDGSPFPTHRTVEADSRAASLSPPQPSRGQWQSSPFKIRTTDGEELAVVAPAVLSGQYDDDFESCSESEDHTWTTDDLTASHEYGNVDGGEYDRCHSAPEIATVTAEQRGPDGAGPAVVRESPFHATTPGYTSADEVDEEEFVGGSDDDVAASSASVSRVATTIEEVSPFQQARSRTTSPRRHRSALPPKVRPHSATAVVTPHPPSTQRPLTSVVGRRVNAASPRTPRRSAPAVCTSTADACPSTGAAGETPTRPLPVQPWRGTPTAPTAAVAAPSAMPRDLRDPTAVADAVIERERLHTAESRSAALVERPGTAVIRAAPTSHQVLEILLLSAWGNTHATVGLSEIEVRGPDGFVAALGPASLRINGECSEAAATLVNGRRWASDAKGMWSTTLGPAASCGIDGHRSSSVNICVHLPGDFTLCGVKLWNYNRAGSTDIGAREIDVLLDGRSLFRGELPQAPGRDSRKHGFLIPVRPPSASSRAATPTLDTTRASTTASDVAGTPTDARATVNSIRNPSAAPPSGTVTEPTLGSADDSEDGRTSHRVSASPTMWLPSADSANTPPLMSGVVIGAETDERRPSISSAGRDRGQQDVAALISSSFRRGSPPSSADMGGPAVESGGFGAPPLRRGSAGRASGVRQTAAQSHWKKRSNSAPSDAGTPRRKPVVKPARGSICQPGGTNDRGSAMSVHLSVGPTPRAPSPADPLLAADTRQQSHPPPPNNGPFCIPLLPSGRKLEIELLTTWGHQRQIGLTGIDIYDAAGHEVVHFADVKVHPAEPPATGCRPAANRLFDGDNLTTDRELMWLARFTGDNRVTVEFAELTTLALVRVWNYNASKGSSYSGVRHVIMRLDNTVIFDGDISKAPGCTFAENPTALGEPILFTVDPEILGRIAQVDRAMAGAH
eukprot:m.419989 g.419989  ORF g.419989 m.419989 type:complete len:1014 (-) comp32008_c0_seq1:22-3063(-)